MAVDRLAAWSDLTLSRLRLYLICLRLYGRRLLLYRMDTLVALTAGLARQVAGLLFLSIVFRRFHLLAGWTYYELLFFYGFTATVTALGSTFLNAPFDVARWIREGDLDVLLVRPVSSLFQVIALAQQPNSISWAVSGFVVLGYAANRLHLAVSVSWVLWLVVGLASATVIRFSVIMALAILAFWAEVRSMMYPFVALYDFMRYPLDVFPAPVRILVTFAIPYALASYYPSAYLLRPAGFWWAGWAVPLAACAMVILTSQMWKAGCRRYESAGGWGDLAVE